MKERDAWHRILPGRQTCALLLPPSLAVLITSSLAVIRPVEALSRQYFFLTPTLLYLYYYPTGPLIVQVESAFLVFLGSLLSIGWINLFLYFTVLANSRHGGESVAGRAASAVGLVLLACISGYIRSRSPRLTNVARIAVFQAIFLLTQDPGLMQTSTSTFFAFFYPSLFAGLASLLSSAVARVILPVRRNSLQAALTEVLDGVRGRVEEQLERVTLAIGREPSPASTPPTDPTPKFPPHGQPQAAIRTLCTLFNEERHTINVACLPATAIKPIVDLVQDRIGRNPICRPALYGMSGLTDGPDGAGSVGTMPRSPLGAPGVASALAGSVKALSDDVLRALACAEAGLVNANGWTDRRLGKYGKGVESGGLDATDADAPVSMTSSRSSSSGFSLQEIHEHRATLDTAIARFEDDIQPWLDAELMETMRKADVADSRSKNTAQRLFRRRLDAQLAFAMVALLDLAKDMLELLDLVQAQVVIAERTAPRRNGRRKKSLHFPKFGSLWLARQLDTERLHAAELIDDEHDEQGANLTEDQAGLHEAEQNRLEMTRSLSRHRSREKPDIGGRMAWNKRLEHGWRSYWDSTTSLDGRRRLSHRLTALKHSRHIKYAFKMGLGIALLSIPGFLPEDSPGRQWFEYTRGQWSITSFMYVLDTIDGATLRIGFYRLIGTIVGAIMGYVSYEISQSNAYGVVIMMVVCNFPISYLILRTPFGSLGTVMGITLPPTILIPYSGLQAGVKPIVLALLRAQDVAIGIVGAILIGMYVFPAHARKRYKEVAAKALDDLGLLYLIMSKENLRHSLKYSTSLSSYGTLERRIESRIEQCRTYASIQHVEPSLLPKPHGLHTRLNDTLQRMFELLLEIRVLRAGLPRQETVLEVLSLRKDLVSAIYIAIFAVAHSVRSNSAMPQYTPDPMAVLQDLGRSIDEHLTQSRPSTPNSSISRGVSGHRSSLSKINLGTLYAYAEREALMRLCQAIAELLDIGRQLLGVQTFYFPEEVS